MRVLVRLLQWHDKAGETYRLPTDAQWEYACRVGTKTTFSFGDDEKQLGEYAWFAGNTAGEQYTHAVGLKKPNPWGLFDMHGNVWEWCSDWYDNTLPGGTNPIDPHRNSGGGSLRVLRGGSWGNDTADCRSAYRSYYVPSGRDISTWASVWPAVRRRQERSEGSKSRSRSPPRARKRSPSSV